MNDERMRLPQALTPDSIATEIGPTHDVISAGYVPVKGYLAAERDGIHRLFRDDRFQDWIEVSTTDIVGRLDIPANETDARSVVYIRCDALVITSRVSRASALLASRVSRASRLESGGDDGGEVDLLFEPLGPPPYHS